MKKIVNALKEISNKLDKMRNGSIYYDNTPEDDCLHSINDIAEKIFATKVDLDLNEEDTIALWDKCIKKAITIYFKYSLVEDNWNEFWRKEAEKIKNEDKEDNNEQITKS